MNETENELLLTAFALQAYQAEHGDYPATLAALVPAYLPANSTDPFATTGTFRYKKLPALAMGKGASFLLYSIGPDGKDDGGHPIENSFLKGKSSYLVFSNGSPGDGDIVAGVNLF